MRILIKKDQQVIGPFALEEVRQKIYSGELTRTSLACLEGSDDWRPVEQIFQGETSKTTSPPRLQLDDLSKLRDPKEKTAFMWLVIMSIPVWLFIIIFTVMSVVTLLIFAGLMWIFQIIAELFFLAHLKTNAIRVSATQLPEIYQAAQTGCERLGMPMPDIYVMQHNVWNAFAAKFFSRRVVVLFSGAVDSILLKGDTEQLMWVVGHELGHHWAGHLDWKHKLASLGNWFFWVHLWYSRRRELTCDRVGLYCSGSLRSSQIALANLTVGAQLAAKVQPAVVAQQWHEHQKEFFVRYRTFYSNYPPLLARMDHLTQAGNELGIR
jgi:Zn-dependent protease with chaperone function